MESQLERSVRGDARTSRAFAPLFRQGAWAFVDQVLSSATNFAMAIIVARMVAPKGFGAFALATATWLTLLGLVRAMVVQPYVVEAAVQDRDSWRSTTTRAAGAIVVVGLLGGLIIAAVGVALGPSGETGSCFVVLGVISPFLVLQDFWRFAAFSRNRARSAVVNDGVWAVAQAACLLLLVFWSDVTPATAIGAWGIGAAAGAVLGMAQFRLVPTFGRGTITWTRHISQWSGWFGLANLFYMGSNAIVAVFVAVWAGPAALGGLRAIQTLLGPGQLVAMSSESVALPAGSRTYAARGRHGLTRFMTVYGAVLTIVLGLYGLVLFLGRTAVLRAVLGAKFVPFGGIVLPLALGLIATAWSFSGALGLRAMLSGRRLAMAEGIAAVAQVTVVGVLTYVDGVRGAAWGVALTGVFHSGSMWWMYRNAARAGRAVAGGNAPDERAAATLVADLEVGAGRPTRGVDLRFPDFYLVGAPKCGTSTMYEALRRHPQLQLPATKEILYFGSDLSFRHRPGVDAYLANFADRAAGRLVGTAHTAYLQSHVAAEEIASVRPDAKIIAMVRNPVDMLHSWHSELLYEAVEEIEDFEGALDAEVDRRRGLRVPKNASNSYVEALFYRDVASFTGQLSRYYDVFGPSRVHVIVFDDLRLEPERAVSGVFAFLGVDEDVVSEVPLLNANKALRSRRVQQVLFHTDGAVRRAARVALPRAVRSRLVAMNTRIEPRDLIDLEFQARLESEFSREVESLGALIGRDLSAWVNTPRSEASRPPEVRL